MKKNKKALALRPETVRLLSATALETAAGGGQPPVSRLTCLTDCNVCPTTTKITAVC
jgi:hypothetical protein